MTAFPQPTCCTACFTPKLMAGQPRALAFGCRCSRARLSGILETFPLDDLDHMDQDGTITMHCSFCNHSFHFQRDEIGGRAA